MDGREKHVVILILLLVVQPSIGIAHSLSTAYSPPLFLEEHSSFSSRDVKTAHKGIKI